MPSQSMGPELRSKPFRGTPAVGWIPVCPPLDMSSRVSSLLGLCVPSREEAGVTEDPQGFRGDTQES